METQAIAKNTGVSADKMRLLVNMVRGKKVDEALTILRFTPTPNASVLAKVIKSAAANAENMYQVPSSELKIVRIYANEAPRLKRFRAVSRGRAFHILKRSSHITVVVSGQES